MKNSTAIILLVAFMLAILSKGKNIVLLNQGIFTPENDKIYGKIDIENYANALRYRVCTVFNGNSSVQLIPGGFVLFVSTSILVDVNACLDKDQVQIFTSDEDIISAEKCWNFLPDGGADIIPGMSHFCPQHENEPCNETTYCFNNAQCTLDTESNEKRCPHVPIQYQHPITKFRLTNPDKYMEFYDFMFSSIARHFDSNSWRRFGCLPAQRITTIPPSANFVSGGIGFIYSDELIRDDWCRGAFTWHFPTILKEFREYYQNPDYETSLEMYQILVPADCWSTTDTEKNCINILYSCGDCTYGRIEYLEGYIYEKIKAFPECDCVFFEENTPFQMIAEPGEYLLFGTHVSNTTLASCFKAVGVKYDILITELYWTSQIESCWLNQYGPPGSSFFCPQAIGGECNNYTSCYLSDCSQIDAVGPKVCPILQNTETAAHKWVKIVIEKQPNEPAGTSKDFIDYIMKTWLTDFHWLKSNDGGRQCWIDLSARGVSRPLSFYSTVDPKYAYGFFGPLTSTVEYRCAKQIIDTFQDALIAFKRRAARYDIDLSQFNPLLNVTPKFFSTKGCHRYPPWVSVTDEESIWCLDNEPKQEYDKIYGRYEVQSDPATMLTNMRNVEACETFLDNSISVELKGYQDSQGVWYVFRSNTLDKATIARCLDKFDVIYEFYESDLDVGAAEQCWPEWGRGHLPGYSILCPSQIQDECIRGITCFGGLECIWGRNPTEQSGWCPYPLLPQPNTDKMIKIRLRFADSSTVDGMTVLTNLIDSWIYKSTLFPDCWFDRSRHNNIFKHRFEKDGYVYAYLGIFQDVQKCFDKFTQLVPGFINEKYDESDRPVNSEFKIINFPTECWKEDQQIIDQDANLCFFNADPCEVDPMSKECECMLDPDSKDCKPETVAECPCRSDPFNDTNCPCKTNCFCKSDPTGKACVCGLDPNGKDCACLIDPVGKDCICKTDPDSTECACLIDPKGRDCICKTTPDSTECACKINPKGRDCICKIDPDAQRCSSQEVEENSTLFTFPIVQCALLTLFALM